MQPKIVAMMTVVRRALFPSGDLKRETPLEIASNPVSDEPPLAKAFSRIKIEAKVINCCECP